MQRRAAAVYFAIFVLLGAGAYAFMQVGMSQPEVEFDAPVYAEGDQFSADGVTFTVASIEATEEGGDHGSAETVHEGNVTWFNETAGQQESVEFQDGDNVTLAGGEYFAYFPSDDRVQVLPTDRYYDDYQQQLAVQDRFNERQSGFWGIVYLSFFGAIVLLGTAYLPVKG